jgi:hypothetical protein
VKVTAPPAEAAEVADCEAVEVEDDEVEEEVPAVCMLIFLESPPPMTMPSILDTIYTDKQRRQTVSDVTVLLLT